MLRKMGSFSAKEARSIAHNRLRMIQQDLDPMLFLWRQASVGEPTLVRTVTKQPSYWIVPVTRRGKVIGFINVELSGVVSAFGYFYRHPQNLEDCPSVVTWFSAAEAKRRARSVLKKYKEVSVSPPVFVHDGAKSKRAWMITVDKRGKLLTRIFITPKLVYERKGDEPTVREDIE